jgi:Protein of unknown function (DUF1488)
MTLTRGEIVAYDSNRMVVLFTMMDDEMKVSCAVTTAAMDDLEGATGTKPDQREDQFVRLRDRIEERATQKYLAAEREGNPPGVILRSLDFQRPRASVR